MNNHKNDDVYVKKHQESFPNMICDQLHSVKLNESCYILSISGLIKNNSNVIIGRSDHMAHVYNVSDNNIALEEDVKMNYDIVGVKACPENENIFYIGTDQSEINVLDIRQKGLVQIFKDTTLEPGDTPKSLSCFDISSNNLLLCGGTNLSGCDAHMLFWDVRNCSLMGAYWESHTDDITQVAFNPNDMNKLISGSTDGLINVYDLSQTSEDDALIDSLNTVSSVDRLVWFNDRYDRICCVTHTQELQFWKLDEGLPYLTVNRENLLTEFAHRPSDDCNVYIADVNCNPINGYIDIVSGISEENSECLFGSAYVKNKLVPTYNFAKNSQIVRCSWFNHKANVVLTGGENGMLDLWKMENSNSNGISL